jgi:hypothetical protein
MRHLDSVPVRLRSAAHECSATEENGDHDDENHKDVPSAHGLELPTLLAHKREDAVRLPQHAGLERGESGNI